jgi:diguanylate cyclase
MSTRPPADPTVGSPPAVVDDAPTRPTARPSSGMSASRQLALRLWATSFATYVVYLGVLAVQIAVGFAPLHLVVALGTMAVVVNLAFFALLRFGRSISRGTQARLGLAQLLFGVVAMLATYAVSGPAAPATTIIMASHIVYAAFSLTRRQIWRLTMAALVGLGLVMLGCHRWQPDRYPGDVQAVTFLYAAIVLPLVARLGGAIAGIQQQLRQRTEELGGALATVQQLATQDDLTRLHNRRHMTELLNLHLRAAERSDRHLAIALLDIDLFKQVNDRHGHQAGDTVLRGFAETARLALRSTDLLARWGGEEFLIAFPDTTIDRAAEGLERLRQALDGRFADLDPELCITFSAGLVDARPGDDLGTVLDRADRALYQAKSNGRDRVEVVAAPTR